MTMLLAASGLRVRWTRPGWRTRIVTSTCIVVSAIALSSCDSYDRAYNTAERAALQGLGRVHAEAVTCVTSGLVSNPEFEDSSPPEWVTDCLNPRVLGISDKDLPNEITGLPRGSWLRTFEVEGGVATLTVTDVSEVSVSDGLNQVSKSAVQCWTAQINQHGAFSPPERLKCSDATVAVVESHYPDEPRSLITKGPDTANG
ncbi:hypothetical protein RN607_13835 [Demequina capsici]|uniref:Uncharacterized protein n=1 Tax=Demequina capsici TaxID=3075620 RepID=A0AA96FET6_9MICO|nr:hypothetical protein [Demequina sp. PMTSA13]WNM27266.1 hypothetical protein RN607_13835 [Demequina sp. PMTSA13]